MAEGHELPNPEFRSLQGALNGRYEQIAFVGRGGMGTVYRALHCVIKHAVAIKVMRPGQSLQRFVREAQVLARIRSPNITRVYDFELLSEGFAALVMEWVEGRDLAGAMAAEGGKIAEHQAVPWMLDVCQGMSAAVREGIVHRDLKPSNILIDDRRKAQVTDFGLARDRFAADDLSASDVIVGTPLYMSPEQAERPHSIDSRSDVYSFGATFYHALTGVPMFEGESAFGILFKHMTEPSIPPKTRNPLISSRVSEVIERCVAKSPDDRFQSFEDIAAVLKPETNLAISPWYAYADEIVETHLTEFSVHRSTYTQATTSFEHTYAFSPHRMLRIVSGDITEQQADAIVSSDDERLAMSGGVSQAILRKAGSEIRDEARRLAPVRQGRAVVTSAGRLPQRFIFHAVTLDYSRNTVLLPSRDIIAELIESCFYHAESLNLSTLALPLLGTGSGGFPKEICLDTMFRVLARLLLRRPTCVRVVTLVIHSEPSS